MATQLHNLARNTAWRMEAITPTFTGRAVPRFQRYDPILTKIQPKKESGWTRKFYVDWEGSSEDGGATDAEIREAVHIIRVHIEYPPLGPWETLHDMILQDRHDVVRVLRGIVGTDYRLGYDDSNSTTDIGLMGRFRVRDSLDKNSNPDVWRLTLEFACHVREDEI